MEFKIEQTELKRALLAVAGCIKEKASPPMLANVLIESVGENCIRITATDLDVTLRVEAMADIIKAGTLCIDAKRLLTLVQALASGSVSITKEPNHWAKLSAQSSKVRIAGQDPKDFPAMPVNKVPAIVFKGDDLRMLIERTLFATSNDVVQYALSGVKLDVGNGIAKMAATDKYRVPLAVCESAEGQLDFILPKKAAFEIAKMDDEEIGISEGKHHIFIEGDGFLLVALKTTGTFPNYDLFFPPDNELTASFDVEAMREAVKRCVLFAYMDTVRLDLSATEVVLRAQSTDAGEIEERISVAFNADPVSIGVRGTHFLDFLNLAENGQAHISFTANPQVPAILTADTLQEYKHVLVLVNLNVQENKAVAATK